VGRGLSAVVVMALAGAGLSACGGNSTSGGNAMSSGPGHKVIGIVRFQTPPVSQGCSGAKPAGGGGTAIPVTVSTRQGQVAAMANVCINGKGPFPFLIDTGADGSIVTTALAKKVGLAPIGTPIAIGGAGCAAEGHTSRVTRWSVAGLPLQPQDVTSLNVPLFGQKGEPDGVIGSDVWSRFGAMRLDFARGTLTVPGPEHGAPHHETVISGPSTSPVPGSLLPGRAAVIAPMRVDMARGFTGISVTVAVGGSNAAAKFTPDTGASMSAIDSGVATNLGLTPVGTRVRQSTVCTIATLPEFRTGPWSIAGHPLKPQSLGAVGLERTTGVAGLLGADQMSHFGSVIFDYSGGRLLLGAG
jgi:predicted aspartyl protease